MRSKFHYTFIALAICFGFGPFGAAFAQDDAAARVGLFDRHCYSRLPDLAGLEVHATENKWVALSGSKLDAFRPAVEPKVLKAWTFSEASNTYTVTVTASDMEEKSKSDFPNFADATNYACSLLLPGDKIKSPEIGIAMEKLIERKADETYDEGPWKVSAWSGQTDELLVLVYHYAPKSGAAGGLLSMTLFQKPATQP